MNEKRSKAEAMSRLRQLLDSGALTHEDYIRLVSAVSDPPTQRNREQSTGSTFIQNAGAIGLGVLTGNLTADLFRGSYYAPVPVEFQYTTVTETIFTDNGLRTVTREHLGSGDDSSMGARNSDVCEDYADREGNSDQSNWSEDEEAFEI